MSKQPHSDDIAGIPYKWARSHIEHYHGGDSLKAEKQSETNVQISHALNTGEHHSEGNREDTDYDGEKLQGKHVLSRVFIAANGARWPVHNGGRKYNGVRDSLARAIARAKQNNDAS